MRFDDAAVNAAFVSAFEFGGENIAEIGDWVLRVLGEAAIVDERLFPSKPVRLF